MMIMTMTIIIDGDEDDLQSAEALAEGAGLAFEDEPFGQRRDQEQFEGAAVFVGAQLARGLGGDHPLEELMQRIGGEDADDEASRRHGGAGKGSDEGTEPNDG